MPQDERTAWNRRYREGSHAAQDVDRFMIEAYEQFVNPLFPHGGAALDVAGGTGRHALYLAERGWRVTLADISDLGIDHARAAANQLGFKLDFLLGDNRELDFGRERFDLVLCFFYLERDIFPKLATALRPGGLIVYKTYTHEHETFASKRLAHPMYFLHDNELLHTFPGYRVLYYRETVKERGIAELVARKTSA